MEIKKEMEQLKQIEMPKEMQERILRNCDRKTEGKNMKRNTTKSSFGKYMTVAASLVLCLCVTGVTALAAAGKLEGFFKDITGWNGAITGTSYEQATDEVEINVTTVGEELAVEVKFLEPETAPYSVLEELGIKTYEILNGNGEVVIRGDATEMKEIVRGMTMINLSADTILNGEYKLIVKELVGGAKADQPLVISGIWECEFTK